jgi:hypothetical protein
MTTDLYRLQSAGRPKVDDSFLAGERDLTQDDLKPYLQPLGISRDLSAIEERIQEIRDDEEIPPQSSDIDAELAPTLHQHLSLNRNQAADAGLWHYLCIVQFSDFVHYRWDHVYDSEDPSNLEEKFLKAGADIYSNALHRLWWAAELTYEPADSGDPSDRDYERTKRALEFQELANDVFDRWFARYRPVAIACVDLLCHDTLDELKERDEYADAPSNSDIVSDTTTLLREELTVRRVETMEADDIVATIESLREDVMKRNTD